MAKKPTKPLKITAKVFDGRINSVDGVIMFDSILYHAWFQKHAPHVLEGNGKEDFNGYVGLPLRQLPGNRWAASRGVYETVETVIEHYNKRPDFFAADKQDKLDMDKGLISSSVGKYRAYRVPNVVRVIKDGLITFYAMGHKDEIEDMLNGILALGKKTAMGWGIVSSWTVEEIDEDYTTYHPEHGLMRPLLPEEAEGIDVSGYPLMEYAVKPPYYKTTNMRLCYVPIQRAETV